MCAICGWINEKESLSHKQEVFQDMVELMNCRGKDSTGYHLEEHAMLGHKRLAIIDVEKGSQPMYHEDYAIVYNGEIYNTEEIRKELEKKGYKFYTTCDTEVVLKGYVEFKEKILDMLEGIFAFCIYDEKTKEAFLARDRFGIKPLYYAKKGNDFLFASMIRPILKSRVIKPYLSKESLGEILALRTIKKTRKPEYLQE